MDQNADTEKLITMEKAVLQAYKKRDETAFRKDFGDDYTGVAGEGILTAADEIKKMRQIDLEELEMSDEKVSFPIENAAVLTYKMTAQGTMNGKKFSGAINTSTVYVNRDGKWQAVLHTESMAQ